MVLDRGKELMLRKDGDVDRRGEGEGMLDDGGGIICYDKEVV